MDPSAEEEEGWGVDVGAESGGGERGKQTGRLSGTLVA
jgi:hypothetical protein